MYNPKVRRLNDHHIDPFLVAQFYFNIKPGTRQKHRRKWARRSGKNRGRK